MKVPPWQRKKRWYTHCATAKKAFPFAPFRQRAAIALHPFPWNARLLYLSCYLNITERKWPSEKNSDAIFMAKRKKRRHQDRLFRDLSQFGEQNAKKTSVARGRIPSAVCNRAQCVAFCRVLPSKNNLAKVTERKNKEWNMKLKLCKVLHLFSLDVLLIRLLEKLVTALNKKLSALKGVFDDFLGCHQTNCEQAVS